MRSHRQSLSIQLVMYLGEDCEFGLIYCLFRLWLLLQSALVIFCHGGCTSTSCPLESASSSSADNVPMSTERAEQTKAPCRLHLCSRDNIGSLCFTKYCSGFVLHLLAFVFKKLAPFHFLISS